MRWPIVLLICLACVLLIAARIIIGRRRFKALNWPKNQGFYGFRRSVMRYMALNGWTVEREFLFPVSFYAEKKSRKVAVIVLPEDMEVRTARLRDMASLLPNVRRNRPIVLVSREEVEPVYLEYGKQLGVTALWYKNLGQL